MPRISENPIERVKAILTKSPEWLEARRNRIGASEARLLLGEEWTDLWKIKLGKQEEDDLSGKLAVQMGTWTEALNMYWVAKTRPDLMLSRFGEHVMPDGSPFAATLDAFVSDSATGEPLGPLECKHVSTFMDDDWIINRYDPQLQIQMACTGSKVAFLSVFQDNGKHKVWEQDFNEERYQVLLERGRLFWNYVKTGEAPPSQEKHKMPHIGTEGVKVDMRENNEWGSNAAAWLGNRDAHKEFETAAKGLKALVPHEASIAHGSGVTAKRSKNGSLTLREEKE